MSESTNFQASTIGYSWDNINKFDKIPTSRTVMYTELIPITGEFLDSASTNLTNKNKRINKAKSSNSTNINSNQMEQINDDFVIIEETFSSAYALPESAEEYVIITSDNNSADKPHSINPETAKTIIASNSELLGAVKMEVDEQYQHIKTEISDESLNERINSEVIIKEEPMNVVEQPIIGENKDPKSIQSFLNENPLVFTSFCGLPNIAMLNALLQYIENDMHTLKNVTKFEQLFSVLTKLHKDEDNFYLNKYIFPPAYVYTVEVLYKKLMPWCNDEPDLSEIPEVLKLEFQPTERVAIIGTLTVLIRSSQSSNKIRSVKYLIAYTGFGEAFFVSKAFTNVIERQQLILECGVLNRLNLHDCVIFYEGEALNFGRVDKPYNEMSNFRDVREIFNEKVDRHVTYVTDRLHDNFKVLHLVPDFMLKNNENICFLDKLVYVCCMLLNMLPRITYK